MTGEARGASAPRTVIVGVDPLSIEDVVALAHGVALLALPTDPHWIRRVERGAEQLQARIRRDEVVYGINTGYGDSCTRTVPPDMVDELPNQLVRYHGCGLGRDFDGPTTAAVLVARIASLARGYSGVRIVLLQRLCDLLHRRILPVIPEEGSVGASGDLTPLSYVAAALIGERGVSYRGQRTTAADALRAEELEPLVLAPKEALAIMNGTAVMTALACLAFERAERLLDLACRITALDVIALRGQVGHFHERLFELKPHPGQARAAARVRGLLAPTTTASVQDPYSLRCAPHVLGVLGDALDWMRVWIETELNSVNDNPLYDPEQDLVLHGGHFYGGHIGLAMDTLKIAVASVADLLDRQLALLVDEKRNRGLPANLSGASAARASIHHGFKAVQIGASAWTAEALKAATPATVYSRSTESHNQDKVSMGTIAARDAVRVLELSEQVAAAGLLGGVQAVHLRIASGELRRADLAAGVCELIDRVHEWSAPLVEDRELEGDLRRTLVRMRTHDAVLGVRDPLTHGAVDSRRAHV